MISFVQTLNASDLLVYGKTPIVYFVIAYMLVLGAFLYFLRCFCVLSKIKQFQRPRIILSLNLVNVPSLVLYLRLYCSFTLTIFNTMVMSVSHSCNVLHQIASMFVFWHPPPYHRYPDVGAVSHSHSSVPPQPQPCNLAMLIL